MITLYQLHWSHYVEKVRWALDFKGVEWRAVDVDPFSKREMRDLPCRSTLVPTIHDPTTGATLGESSSIIEYLEQTYPTPPLFSGNRDEVRRWMLWLDSTLGLAARRLAYTQMALEHPAYLTSLFLPRMPAGSIKARIAGKIIAGVLTRRFRFRYNRADRVFEELQQCLLLAAERLSSREYLVGDCFTAADLTLAALMRPAVVVPYFADQPRLQRLFVWRRKQLQEHRRPELSGYESALHEMRKRRGWALGRVSWLQPGSDAPALAEVPDLQSARNDQQSLGGWPLLTGAFEYLLLKQTCRLGRTAYSQATDTSANQISRQR
jgi:glutathione S-transferase